MKKSGFLRIRCPKCGGNVYLDSDIEGWYEECLQCGHISDMPQLKAKKELVKITERAG
jgi:ribosomal protein S27E